MMPGTQQRFWIASGRLTRVLGVGGLALAVGGLAIRAGATLPPPAATPPAVSAGAPAAVTAVQSARRAGAGVLRLAGAGAPELALDIINQSQPAYAQAPRVWAAWERIRFQVLSAAGDMRRLFVRLDALPASAPASLRASALLLGAQGALGVQEPARGRHYLRKLIWNGKAPPAPELLAEYRRLVIRSYVVNGDFGDAARALTYLHRSGRGQDWRLRLLAAEIALERGRPQAAIRHLSGIKQPAARAAMLLAELQAGVHPPGKIRVMAIRAARAAEQRHHNRLAGRLQWVAAQAALRAGNEEAGIRALLATLRLDPGDVKPFRTNAASVWTVLIEAGLALGNSEQLLIGDAGPWLNAAQAQQQRKHPILALAILAATGLNGPDAPGRARALAAFAQELSRQPHGGALLLALFADRKRFPAPRQLPGAVRYRLLAPALTAGRIGFASRLLAGLKRPPQGIDPGVWQLERARLFLLGGDIRRGTAVLERLVAGQPPVDPAKLLPVILDLETLNHNKQALQLLLGLMRRRPSPQVARQVLYWMGHAYVGLGVPLLAARAYLESATFTSPYALDQWAKTARYAAAAALTGAGLYADARRLYQGLLNATSDPTEQALLKQKLAAIRTLAGHKVEHGSN